MIRSTSLLAAALSTILLVAASVSSEERWKLESPKPAVALQPPRLEKLEGETCGKCHADVVEEWVSTAHAISWVVEVYRDEV